MSRPPTKVIQADVARTIRAAIQAGVVVPWQWSDLMADVTVTDLRAVQAISSKGRYRASPQAEDWVGKAVAEALRFDLAKPADKRKAANLIKIWLESGGLERVEEKDDKGMSRPFVILGVGPMIKLPTTAPGEVWSGEETGHQHHHHHLLRGVGVWWGYKKLDLAGGERSSGVRSLHLKIQAGCRGYGA